MLVGCHKSTLACQDSPPLPTTLAVKGVNVIKVPVNLFIEPTFKMSVNSYASRAARYALNIQSALAEGSMRLFQNVKLLFFSERLAEH